MAKNQSVGRVSIEMTADVVQFVNKLHKADKDGNGSLLRIARGFQKTSAAAKKGSKGIDGLSGRLRNMGQAAALVSGPMGGISSRLSVMGTIVSQGPLIAGIAAIGLAFTALYKIFKHGALIVDNDIMQLAQLSATIDRTGHAAGITTGEVDAFAQTLAMNTLASVTDVRKAMGKLATFTKITGQNFFDTTKIAEDMAAAGFGSVIDNAVQLGKALSDPIKNLGALTRNGITFTNKQKLLIVELAKENKLYEAQAKVLKIIHDQLGNTATAQAFNTIAGAADTMGQRFDDLSKVFGNMSHGPILDFMQALDDKIRVLTLYLDPTFEFKMKAPTKARKYIESLGLDLHKVTSGLMLSNMTDSFTKAIKNMRGQLFSLELTQQSVSKKLSSASLNIGGKTPLNIKKIKALQLEKDLIDAKVLSLKKALITIKSYRLQTKASTGEVSANLSHEADLSAAKNTQNKKEFEARIAQLNKESDVVAKNIIKQIKLEAIQTLADQKAYKAKQIQLEKEKKAKDKAFADDVTRRNKENHLKINSGLGLAADLKGKKYSDLFKLKQEFANKSAALENAIAAASMLKDITITRNLLAAKKALDKKYAADKVAIENKAAIKIAEDKALAVAAAKKKYKDNSVKINSGLGLAADLKGKKYSDLFKLKQDFADKSSTLDTAIASAKMLNDTTALTALSDAKLALVQQYEDDKAAIEDSAAANKKAKDLSLIQFTAQATTSALSGLSDMYQKTGKDHARAQKNIFLLTQAIAFGMNVVNTQSAMSDIAASKTIPELAKPALAATALTEGIIRGVTIASATIGAFHGGTDSVPKAYDNQSFLLKAGERVVQPQANKDLTSFLKNGNSNGSITVSAPITIQGNVTDQRWFQAELVKNRQLISVAIDKAKSEKPNSRYN